MPMLSRNLAVGTAGERAGSRLLVVSRTWLKTCSSKLSVPSSTSRLKEAAVASLNRTVAPRPLFQSWPVMVHVPSDSRRMTARLRPPPSRTAACVASISAEAQIMVLGGSPLAALPHCTAHLALQRWNSKTYPFPRGFTSMKLTESAAWPASPHPQPYSSDSVSFRGFLISSNVRVNAALGLCAPNRATRPGCSAALPGYVNTSQSPLAFHPNAARSPRAKSLSTIVSARQTGWAQQKHANSAAMFVRSKAFMAMSLEVVLIDRRRL